MEEGRGLYMVFVLMEWHISTVKDLEEKKDEGKNILMTWEERTREGSFSECNFETFLNFYK